MCTRNGQTPAQAVAVIQRFPQELINVQVADKHALEGNEAIAQAVRAAEEALGDEGRVLVRPSGTEPLIRVMVEAADDETALAHAQAVAHVVEAELGA